MIYSGKRLKLEFFDKDLNGTFRGDFKYKKPIELDTEKRLKLGTQLKKYVLKDELLSEHINNKNNGAVMVELICNKDNSITTLIDLR